MGISAFNRHYDGASVFRAPKSAAITTDGATATDAVDLDKLAKSRGFLKDKLGAQGYEIAVVVEDVDLSPAGSIALSGVLTSGDAFTFDDGTNAAVQLVAGTDFAVGATAADSATNLTNAINAATLDMTARHDGAGTVHVENNASTDGSITEDTDAGAVATVTDFAGADESYTLDVEVGPEGFATSAVVATLAVDAAGNYVLLVDAETAEKLDSDHDQMRVNLTIAHGDVQTASIKYAAWVL